MLVSYFTMLDKDLETGGVENDQVNGVSLPLTFKVM